MPGTRSTRASPTRTGAARTRRSPPMARLCQGCHRRCRDPARPVQPVQGCDRAPRIAAWRSRCRLRVDRLLFRGHCATHLLRSLWLLSRQFRRQSVTQAGKFARMGGGRAVPPRRFRGIADRASSAAPRKASRGMLLQTLMTLAPAAAFARTAARPSSAVRTGARCGGFRSPPRSSMRPAATIRGPASLPAVMSRAMANTESGWPPRSRIPVTPFRTNCLRSAR